MKKSINPLSPGKFCPKNEIYFHCYEIWQSEQVKFVNHECDIWNCRSWPKIKNLGRFGLKVAMCPIFMKFGTQNKSNMLIINILIGIDDLDPKLQICEIWSQNWNVLQFLWNLALEQMEHANYKYSTWNWWSWPKIIDSGKFGPKIAMCSNFHEIWHSGHF